MHKTIVAAVAGVLIAGLAACAPQPGYGPGYGYGSGPGYGYGPSPGYGYYSQPAPAPNPLAQMMGALMTPNGGGYGGGQGYYQPGPYYGGSYGGWR